MSCAASSPQLQDRARPNPWGRRICRACHVDGQAQHCGGCRRGVPSRRTDLAFQTQLREGIDLIALPPILTRQDATRAPELAQSLPLLRALVPDDRPWDARFVAPKCPMEKQTLELLDSALDAVRRGLSPRAEELARKSTSGTLTTEELAEYTEIVRLNDNLALLKLQAQDLSAIRSAS